MSGPDYPLSRRAMLGATGATLLGWQVRDLLALGERTSAPTAEHVILFWNAGGMSHIDTWDPKPGRPTAGEFQPIQTSAPGVEISEIFPQLAQQMHHCSLIRSLVGSDTDHTRATYHWQTGYEKSSERIHPGLGSIVADQLRPLSGLPVSVSINGRGPGAGDLGRKCEPYFVAEPGEPDVYGALSTRAAREVFDLNQVPTSTLNRYGDTSFGRGCLLARRLVESGVRFVQVHRSGFDTHALNFPSLRCHGEVMDPALASLVSDLAESGLLQKTLIVMLSEFGRSPEINGEAGRDHWASVFSCLLAGGGIPGGQVIGASDKSGYQPQDRPIHVADLHATIYHALGINPGPDSPRISRPSTLDAVRYHRSVGEF